MVDGFLKFIARGNVLDLAVGVIIGAAFTAIVNSLVADIITPLIGAIFGNPDFSAITLGPLKIGNFINAVISFLLVAVAVYFFIIVPMNHIAAMTKKPAEPETPAPTDETKVLMEIRDLLKAQSNTKF